MQVVLKSKKGQLGRYQEGGSSLTAASHASGSLESSLVELAGLLNPAAATILKSTTECTPQPV